MAIGDGKNRTVCRYRHSDQFAVCNLQLTVYVVILSLVKRIIEIWYDILFKIFKHIGFESDLD